MWCPHLEQGHSPVYTCNGTKHGQASLEDPQGCPHCADMPEKVLEWRLRVAGTNCQGACLPAATAASDMHHLRAPTSWADMTEKDPPPTLLTFEVLLDQNMAELGGKDTESDADSNLINLENMEEEEDSTFPTEQCRSPNGAEVAPPVDTNLYEV